MFPCLFFAARTQGDKTVGFIGLLLIGAAFAVGFIIREIGRSRNQKASEEAIEAARKSRAEGIRQRYPADIAQRIIDGIVWVDQPAAMLRDALGQPHDIDEKVLKTKRREVWKYRHRGGNRYGLRITVEDGRVAGWEEK